MSESAQDSTFLWHEINTPDPAGAKSFYTDLIGWGTKDMDMGGGTYTMFTNGGSDIGGIMAHEAGGSGPPHWVVYIGVDDVDATAAKCEKLGGKITVPPTDVPPGRFAMLTDPSGAAFAVFKPAG